MRKGILLLAALVTVCVIVVAVYLFAGPNQCEYDGYFSVNVDGVSCRLNLSGITAHEMDGRMFYHATFSDSGQSADVSFTLWEEGGQVWLNLDNPILKISGQQYLMPSPLQKSNYSFDGATEHTFFVTFYDVPYSSGFRLNGRMCFQVHGGTLY